MCKISRIEEAYRKHSDRFVERLLTPEERLNTKISSQFLARRFSAKEACAKALGCGIGAQLSFQDLTVLRLEGQRPTVTLSTKAQKNFPDITLHLSLSDDGDYAQAFAVAERL